MSLFKHNKTEDDDYNIIL